MAGSLNKAMVLGNLGRDPEVRSTQSGTRMASFSVATTEKWRDREGEHRERTEWHRIVIFSENLVNVVERHLRKGSRVYVEGELRTRKWTDSTSGHDRYSTEIVLQGFRGQLIMLGDSRGGGGGGGERSGEGGGQGGESRGGESRGYGGRGAEERERRGGSAAGKPYSGASGESGEGGTDSEVEDEIPF